MKKDKKKRRFLWLLLPAAVLVGAGLLFFTGPEEPAHQADSRAQAWLRSMPPEARADFHRQFQKNNDDGIDPQWWADWFEAHRDDPAYEMFFDSYEEDSSEDDWGDGLLDFLFGDDEDWDQEDDWLDDDDWNADSWWDTLFGEDWEDENYDDWDEDYEDYDDVSWFDILFDW